MDIKKRNEIVEKNLGLAKKMAFEYSRKSLLDFEDLYQEGVMGLMTAAEKFDESKGFKFSTYANYWITQKMQRYIESSLPCSSTAARSRHKVYEAKKHLENEGLTPTHQDIAEITGMSLRDIDGILYQTNVSIYEPVGDERMIVDTLEDVETNLEKKYEVSEKQELIRKSLEILTPRQKAVIELRYLHSSGKIRTFEQVSQELNVARQRVQGLEKAAMRRLRFNQNVRNLSEEA